MGIRRSLSEPRVPLRQTSDGKVDSQLKQLRVLSMAPDAFLAGPQPAISSHHSIF